MPDGIRSAGHSEALRSELGVTEETTTFAVCVTGSTFGQFTRRKTRHDFEASLAAGPFKPYHPGFCYPIRRPAEANASEGVDQRIQADFAQHKFAIARSFHSD